MLSLLRVSYPTFYSKMKTKDMALVLDLWAETFAMEDVNIVKVALLELISTHTGFPPDIAAVKSKIKDFVSVATGEPTDAELWQMLKRAASRGYYGAEAEFEKLPRVLQRFVGSPATIREYSMIDSDTFNTVVHGQFLKQIKIIRDREDYDMRLPENVKAFISAAYNPLLDKRALTESETNARRNNILNALEN